MFNKGILLEVADFLDLSGLCFITVNHLSKTLRKQKLTSRVQRSHLWVLINDFDLFCLFLFLKVHWLIP